MTTPRHPAYWPTNGWRRSTPEEQGIDPVMLARAAHEARDNLPPQATLDRYLITNYILPAMKLVI